MNSNKKKARIAGLWYLIIVITGIFGIAYVPSSIFVEGDPVTTANNIITSNLLFRSSIVSSLICQMSFIFLVLALFDLLKGVNKKHASLMAILVIASVPIAFLNELNHVAALVLLSGADFLSVFEPDQLNGMVMFFHKLHEYGIFIVSLFWGLWLFPFGFLVYKSGFLPKILGIFLMISCFAYLVDSLMFLVFPNFADIVSNFTSWPAALGEFSIVLWLLIMGAKEQPKQ